MVKGRQNGERACSQTGRGPWKSVAQGPEAEQSPVIPFIQRQNWTRATGHSWNLQTVWQILTHFMASPMVLSTTQSHDFMETEAALAFTPHSNCGGDQPLLPQVTPPKADTSEQLFSEARPRLLPVK